MIHRVTADDQYAVTETSRVFPHGHGVPGIFFKYDLEPMSITIRERTTTLYQFLIRLVGVIGEFDPVHGSRQVEYGLWLHLHCAWPIALRRRLSRSSTRRRKSFPQVAAAAAQVDL